MKSLVKLAGAFALGIIVTTAVILPKVSQNTAEPATAPVNQPKIVQTLDATGTEAETTPIELKAEIAVEAEAVTEEIKAITTPEPTYTTEPQKSEVKAETVPKPASEVKQASPPQATAAQPETWWEDGKQYTMINGHKALISDEGNNQLSYYDWENDPLKNVPGPFNGNGGNGN